MPAYKVAFTNSSAPSLADTRMSRIPTIVNQSWPSSCQISVPSAPRPADSGFRSMSLVLSSVKVNVTVWSIVSVLI